MNEIISNTIELQGSNYEIGYYLGKEYLKHSKKEELYIKTELLLNDNEKEDVINMFNKWCPGLNEEILGFADALGIDVMNVLYYSMTYLRPCCSQIGLLPSKTNNNHTILARNYEFNHLADDFTLVRTLVKDKYTHLGTSVMNFGRDEGINEHGLAITMSSCGFPVGGLEFMRQPKVVGLQFWAVIRSLLENCKTVKEALVYLEDMPIAYNINLMIADNDNIVLFATLDGLKLSKVINQQTEDNYLLATNHPCFEEMKKIEKTAMRHSLKRYDIINEYLNLNSSVSIDGLKDLLLKEYPYGLYHNHYTDFLGTTKSVIIDVNDKSYEICWGGNVINGWNKYSVSNEMKNTKGIVLINDEPLPKNLIDTIEM